MANNGPARGLQRKLGFEQAYTCWYKVPKPPVDPSGANC